MQHADRLDIGLSAVRYGAECCAKDGTGEAYEFGLDRGGLGGAHEEPQRPFALRKKH